MRRWISGLLLAGLLLGLFGSPARAGVPNESRPNRLPVILVPGIGGSELYNGSELIWVDTLRLIGRQLPGFDLLTMGWLTPLRLRPDGQTPWYSSSRIRVGDLLRHGLADGYSGLIRALEGKGYRLGHDLRLLPYDWRKEPTEAAAALDRLVERTLRETGAPKVILVGHSLGGLVGREYLIQRGGERVAALITLATPWLGSPIAYRALRYGWDLGLKLPGTRWSLFAPSEVRLLVQNYGSVYALAPSPRYWDWYPEGYLERGGRALDHAQSHAWGMAPHNKALAARGAEVQSRWLDGRHYGVPHYLLVGTGSGTLGGISEWQDWLGFSYKQERFVDGDEVVPLHSADLGFSQDPSAPARYLGRVEEVRYLRRPHTLMAQFPETHAVVLGWVDQVNAPQPVRP